MKKLITLIFAIILLAGCIGPVKYYKAHSLYMKSSYQEAVGAYDKYLESAPDNAQRVHAEIERSDCYYQLGYNSYQEENWETAGKLLFLSNSPIADQTLDDCYFNLAMDKLASTETTQAMEYFDKILSKLPDSDKVPEILSLRIKIYLKQDLRTFAFEDYNQLLSEYPQSEYTKEVLPEIDKLIPVLLNDALLLKEDNRFEEALRILKNIMKYPTRYLTEIESEISLIYILIAENAIQKNDLSEAKQNFESAIIYDTSCESDVQARINEVCSAILTQGNNQLKNLQFDAAISTYQKCFTLIENHPNSQAAIEYATQRKQNYAKAEELLEKASDLEQLRSYKEAMNYYKQASNYYPSTEISEKIFIMQNLLDAHADPKAFAKKIIRDYKGGALENAVKEIEQEMHAKHGIYVTSSDWKVTFAIGQYKYEVRYDIVATKETYYFAWNVDIRTKSVTPSNKVSEKMMLDANLIKLEDKKK
jgi:tetratricopeptide (TPR) repeat protein